MMDFFRSLFGRRELSGTTAKERLKLVLISDHLSLAPDVVQALKVDLIEVISRYLDIDHEAADVTFEPRGNEIAMLANIPILGVRDTVRRAAAVPPPIVPTPPPAVVIPFVDSTEGEIASVEPARDAEPANAEEASTEPVPIVRSDATQDADDGDADVEPAERPLVAGGAKRGRGGTQTATIVDAR